MAGDKGSGNKGFAGLDSMVSEVEVTKMPVSQQVRKEGKATPPEPDYPPEPAYAGTPTGGGESGKWWLIGIGIVAFFVWVGNSKEESPTHEASAYEAPAVEAVAPAPYYPPSEPVQTYEPTPAPAPVPVYETTSNEEEVPPVGSGLELNRSQIRYCLSEDIRISAWEQLVNEYSESSVNAFNAAVNDYNTRCSSFRYRRGTLESVRAEVEANRNTLTLQGKASGMANQ